MIKERLTSDTTNIPNNIASEEDSPFAAHRTIKAMHADERPREKALHYGCGALTVPELWAMILGTGTKGVNILELCYNMMARNDHHLATLARRSLKEMLEIKGLGPNKALQVMAVMELVKRFNKEEIPERPQITSAADVHKLMLNEIGYIGHEEIWVLMLNRANRVTKIMQLTSGSATATVFDVKLVLKNALIENAEGLILCHNHPSGQLRPSGQDDNITQQCKRACDTLSIRFLDHVIVCSTGYYSYNDNGKL
jgi:DNA repair protein RadC